MAIAQTGSRNLMAALRRAAAAAWFGAPTAGVEAPPIALNNEFINVPNAANTAYVGLAKINANNLVELGSGVSNRLVAAPAKTITDASATSLFDVAFANDTRCGGAFIAVIEASDGTDDQAMTVLVTYAAVDKAGTKTLTITDLATVDAKAVSAGTLTLAWTFVTGAGKGTVKLQPTGSLTETLYTVTYTVLPIVGAVTIL